MWQIWATLRPLHQMAFLALAAHAARQERDQARYDDIARLADLTFPYLEGTATSSEILPKMPDAERAQATDIFNRLQPTEVRHGSESATS